MEEKVSLLYRILGIPGSLPEFFDKASKQNQNVTITVGCNPNPTSFVYSYFIELKSGSTRFVMHDFSVGKCDPEAEKKRKNLEFNLLKQVENIQYLLGHMGLEAKIISGGGDVISPGYNSMQQSNTPSFATA